MRHLTVQPPSKYTIRGQQGCVQHARERHTCPGILKANEIRTDHVSHVAIFDDPAELSNAVGQAPTAPNAWRRLTNGFYRARCGDAFVYGDVNGDTVSLQTCFPVGGRTEYPRDRVKMALDHAEGDLETFIKLVKGAITPEDLKHPEDSKGK